MAKKQAGFTAASKLKFSSGRGNSKLQRWNHLYTFALRAGHDCPFARACKSKVVLKKGKARIQDGDDIEFRCLGASCEIRSKNLREKSARNSALLRSIGTKDQAALTRLIDRSIPEDARVVRIHTTGGDFLTQEYFKAWLDVVAQYPDILFYGYTKALPYYVMLKDMFPENFRFTPSRGGTHDNLIDKHDLHEARVVYHPDEAKELGWPIDHDDSHAMAADHSFCLLIHGQQAAGSEASFALKLLRQEGIKFGYSRGTKEKREE